MYGRLEANWIRLIPPELVCSHLLCQSMCVQGKRYRRVAMMGSLGWIEGETNRAKRFY